MRLAALLDIFMSRDVYTVVRQLRKTLIGHKLNDMTQIAKRSKVLKSRYMYYSLTIATSLLLFSILF